METTILIGTSIVSIGGIVMICLVLWKIFTGDYSRPVNEREMTASAEVVPGSGQVAHLPPNPMQASAALEQELAPVYFIPELRNWNNAAEREKAGSDLAEIKKRRREAK